MEALLWGRRTDTQRWRLHPPSVPLYSSRMLISRMGVQNYIRVASRLQTMKLQSCAHVSLKQLAWCIIGFGSTHFIGSKQLVNARKSRSSALPQRHVNVWWNGGRSTWRSGRATPETHRWVGQDVVLKEKKFQPLPGIVPRSSSPCTDWTIGYVCSGDYKIYNLFVLKLSSLQGIDRAIKGVCRQVVIRGFTALHRLFPFSFATVCQSKLQMLYDVTTMIFIHQLFVSHRRHHETKRFRAVILLFLIYLSGRYYRKKILQTSITI